tara:strand:- start:1245 stop:2135 length:891 start_codon:yes stop_codon:yes gene_type:complete
LYDITLVTCKKYFQPKEVNDYLINIQKEEDLLRSALENNGLKVDVTFWNDVNYNWSKTKIALIRTTWDYYQNISEFISWIDKTSQQTKLINSNKLLKWNLDKSYLFDLEKKGVQVVPTVIVNNKYFKTLTEITNKKQWNEIIIKPAISAAAYKTYRLKKGEFKNFENKFFDLVTNHDMLVQPFFSTILDKGEASLMLVNGKFTHAILKKAKTGDFRVQDDFGGMVYEYEASKNEINLAEKVFSSCEEMPLYGRVDIMWDDSGKPTVSELEIIEPEIWMRNYPKYAEYLADAINKTL